MLNKQKLKETDLANLGDLVGHFDPTTSIIRTGIQRILTPDLAPPHVLTTGQKLEKELGLEKFASVWITKILNLPIHAYVIFVNSRFPTSNLSYTKIRHMDSIVFQKLQKTSKDFILHNFKYTPPIHIRSFDGVINSGSMIIRVDIGGEYFMQKNWYESKEFTGMRFS